LIIEFLKRHICIYKVICQALVCSEEGWQEDEFRSTFCSDLSVICLTFQLERTCLISDILYLLLRWLKQTTKRILMKTTWIHSIHFRDQTFLFFNQVFEKSLIKSQLKWFQDDFDRLQLADCDQAMTLTKNLKIWFRCSLW